MHHDPAVFDIDVDLSPFLETRDPVLVTSRWYKLLRPSAERPQPLQRKIEAAFKNALLKAQWDTARARTERRRAVRAPLLSRVHAGAPERIVACDISLAGLRCSGRPHQDVFDIEFKLPGLQFPVEARAEVTNFKDGNVIPLMGLRFVDINPPYIDHINRYVGERRAALMAA